MTAFTTRLIQPENAFHRLPSLADAAEDFFLEKGFGSLGSDGIHDTVQAGADAVLAVAHAEGGVEIDLILQVVLVDEALEGLGDLLGAFQVAGTSDADGQGHGCFSFHVRRQTAGIIDNMKRPAATGKYIRTISH